jgi:hypothetical protein
MSAEPAPAPAPAPGPATTTTPTAPNVVTSPAVAAVAALDAAATPQEQPQPPAAPEPEQTLSPAALAQLTEHLQRQGLVAAAEPPAAEAAPDPPAAQRESALHALARQQLATVGSPSDMQVAAFAEAVLQVERWSALVRHPEHGAKAPQQIRHWQREIADVQRNVRLDAALDPSPAPESTAEDAVTRIGATSSRDIAAHWPTIAAAMDAGRISLPDLIALVDVAGLTTTDEVANRVSDFFSAVEQMSPAQAAPETRPAPASAPLAANPANPATGSPTAAATTAAASAANLNDSEFDAEMSAALARAGSRPTA